jgi:hypothetical protein
MNGSFYNSEQVIVWGEGNAQGSGVLYSFEVHKATLLYARHKVVDDLAASSGSFDGYRVVLRRNTLLIEQTR